jgi:hypothetical protein
MRKAGPACRGPPGPEGRFRTAGGRGCCRAERIIVRKKRCVDYGVYIMPVPASPKESRKRSKVAYGRPSWLLPSELHVRAEQLALRLVSDLSLSGEGGARRRPPSEGRDLRDLLTHQAVKQLLARGIVRITPEKVATEIGRLFPVIAGMMEDPRRKEQLVTLARRALDRYEREKLFVKFLVEAQEGSTGTPVPPTDAELLEVAIRLPPASVDVGPGWQGLRSGGREPRLPQPSLGDTRGMTSLKR